MSALSCPRQPVLKAVIPIMPNLTLTLLSTFSFTLASLTFSPGSLNGKSFELDIVQTDPYLS